MHKTVWDENIDWYLAHKSSTSVQISHKLLHSCDYVAFLVYYVAIIMLNAYWFSTLSVQHLIAYS